MKKRNLIIMAALFTFTIGIASVHAKSNSEIKSEDLDSFTTVEAKVNTSNINIVKGDKYKIEIDYRQPKEKINYKVKNNKLIINTKRKWSIFPEFGPQPYNVITVYAPDIENVKFNSKSGDFLLDSFKISELSVGTISGDIELEDSNVQKIYVKTTSGDMNIKSSKLQDVNVSTVSGDIKLETSDMQKVAIKTTSGDLDIYDVRIKDINTATISGDINMNLVEQSNLKLKSVSGTIKIDGKIYEREYNEDNSFGSNINVKSSSGDITITHR